MEKSVGKDGVKNGKRLAGYGDGMRISVALKLSRSTRKEKKALDFFTEVWTYTHTSVHICMFWAEPMLTVPAEPNSADTKQGRSFEGVLLAPITKPSDAGTEHFSLEDWLLVFPVCTHYYPIDTQTVKVLSVPENRGMAGSQTSGIFYCP